MARIKHVILVMSVLFCTITLAEEKQAAKESLYEQLCRAVIRLEHLEVVPQEQGPPQSRLHLGTAFFVASSGRLYVVSARHVVEKQHDLSSRVQLVNPHTGDTAMFKLELPHDRWVYHPNSGDEDTHYVDVAAMRVFIRSRYYPRCFVYEPNDPNMKEQNQLPSGDEQPPEPVLVFGFPVDLGFELAEQRPMARLGIMSMSAGREFLKCDTDGATKFAEERCCLIDARMFLGNSGSPVMNQLRLGNSKPRLLGLVIATNRGLDFGVMEPVSRIRETLDVAKTKAAAGSWTPIPEETKTVAEPNAPD